MTKFSFLLWLVWWVCSSFGQTKPNEMENLQWLKKKDRSRFYAYPNGWGATPEAARKDLERVLAIYEKRPNYRRHSYAKVILFSRNLYQCDGVCSFYAPEAQVASNPRKR